MDVMIDIETLANTSNAVINQLAAVVFDRHTGEIIDKFKKNVDTQTCVDIGLELSVETIEWWLGQSKDAQNSILEKPRYSIKDALQELYYFFIKSWKNVHDDVYNIERVNVWCHTTFDEPVLENAFRKTKTDVPWHYRSGRDLRTLVDLANYTIDKNKNVGTAHDALDDCLFQIEYTVKCINIISNT